MTDRKFTEEQYDNLTKWSKVMDDYGAWGRLLGYFNCCLRYTSMILAYIVGIFTALAFIKEPLLRYLGGTE